MKKLLALLCVSSSACSVVDSTPQARQRAALLQPGWTEVGDYDARTQHAMAPLGSTLVLFGGLTNTELGDTWVWDDTKWSRRTPATAPLARYAHQLATLGTRVVLFGGSSFTAGIRADTWEWDGTTWLQRAPATSPPARERHVMTEFQGKVLRFGGGPVNRDDTWEWNGTTWTQRTPSRVPRRVARRP